MFLENLRMSRLMEADTGANGGADTGKADTAETGADTQETTQEEKTFTQAEVDNLLKERVARLKKEQPSKEELKAYNDWKESQKTEEEKKDEALTNAEKAKLAAEERALLAETKVTCLSKGVIATSVDDVVTLAKAMVTEEVTIEQAIDKVLEKYPNFKGKQQQEEQKGFIKIGAENQRQKENSNDALARAFGNK
ncbi:MAG: hypothetical protein SO128_00385 [Clostridium cadaveris]|uniref:DUF4355 domain-containing protein n=1 Tax=Clostridium cadaveris TaxID=1529 RepID=A0A1I2KU31_9CLOT|nr:hypothetical protein [Clostridium cadaveris]MDU4953473.1 hypothetical protein [Clostridium sp.]MDY4947813.1 hypothetical protein [Clostridium cadaveris]SFF68581.1 hypothetical protein SAMN04487885_106150 [Clostridium cadaveris]